jgi:hypothetical protein
VSADPLTVHGAGADLNAYAYVHGSLLRATDPVGLDLWDKVQGYAAELPGLVAKQARITYIVVTPIAQPYARLEQAKDLKEAYDKAGGGADGRRAVVERLNPFHEAGESARRAEQAERSGDDKAAGRETANEHFELVRNVLQLVVGGRDPRPGKSTRPTRSVGEIKDSISSLEARLAEHEQKLADYKANPDAYDNKGFLKGASSPEIREKIISGRVRHLEGEIANFRKQLVDLQGQLPNKESPTPALPKPPEGDDKNGEKKPGE